MLAVALSLAQDGFRLVVLAAQEGHADCASMLLTAKGCLANKTDATGASPLYTAAEKGKCSVVKVLVKDPSVDVNQVSHSCSTVSHSLYATV